MPDTVAIIGAGRLGSVVAQRLPAGTGIIVFDHQGDKGRQLAEAVQGTFVVDLADTGPADLFILAIPAPAVNATVESLLRIARKEAIILNMATAAYPDPELRRANPGVTIMDAKIIGQARAIAEGEPGIVVINCPDPEKSDLVKRLLQGFCRVECGDVNQVEIISKIASIEGIRAAIAVRRQLRALGVPEDWINTAIGNCCAGTMKAFANNDIGPFSQQIVKDLELKD